MIVRDHVVVLDVANGRLTVFPRAGGEPKHHPVRYADHMLGDTLARVVLPLRSTEGQRLRALRVDILRMQADTLTLPWVTVPGGTVEVTKQQGSTFRSAETTVPYSREVVWSYSRFGEIIGGNNDRYTLDQILPSNRALRIVRNTTGAAVSADERRFHIENMEKAIRPLDENYRYSGPRLSATKPLFTQVFADHDGRIWLTRPLASVRERSWGGVAWLGYSAVLRFDRSS